MKSTCSVPLLFLGLCLSALAGAQAGATLLVTTDMDCNWKLDGQAQGMLDADDSKVVRVSSGKHLIEATTLDHLASVRLEVSVDQGQKIVEIQLKEAWELKFAALDVTWTDPNTGLTWAGQDNGSNLTWQQAASYCKNLRLGGHSDWRLPEISELAAIYDPERKFFDPSLNYHGQHIKGGIRMTGVGYWSNTAGDASGQASEFRFMGGARQSNFLDNSEGSRALCVRRSGE